MTTFFTKRFFAFRRPDKKDCWHLWALTERWMQGISLQLGCIRLLHSKGVGQSWRIRQKETIVVKTNIYASAKSAEWCQFSEGIASCVVPALVFAAPSSWNLKNTRSLLALLLFAGIKQSLSGSVRRETMHAGVKRWITVLLNCAASKDTSRR